MDPRQADPWREGDRMARASGAAGLAWTAAAFPAWALGFPEAALLLLAFGGLVSAAFAGLWRRLPRRLGRPVTECACAWATVAAWQGGVLLSALALTGAPAAGMLGAAGGFLLVAGAFLGVDHFGSALYRARGWRRLPAFFLAALPVPLAGLLLALSFRGDALPGSRGWSFILAGSGSLMALAMTAGRGREGSGSGGEGLLRAHRVGGVAAQETGVRLAEGGAVEAEGVADVLTADGARAASASKHSGEHH